MEKIDKLIEQVNDELSRKKRCIHITDNGRGSWFLYWVDFDGEVNASKENVKEEDLYKAIEDLYNYLRD